jgi:surface glycoprotein (TIGR04207 family)
MTRERFRATFLAAIMLLSVVAMGAGFAGSVAGDGDTYTVGSADDADFDTVAAALNSGDVSEGDTVEVRSGTYREMVDVDIEGVTISGVGDPVIAVPEDGAVGGEPNIEVTGSNVTIEGLEVDVNNPNGAPTGGIILEGNNGTAVDNTVINTADTVSGQGFIAGGGESLRIENNTLNDTVVAYWGNADAEIRNNEFTGEVTDEALWATTSDELTVENNDFGGVDTGSSDIKLTADGVTINGETGDETVANTLDSSNTDVDSITLAGQTYDKNGNVIVSNGDSIQQAIDDADPGTTLVVDGGTYEEQLTIDKEGISLVAGEETPELTSSSGVVVQIHAANATVSGFDIVGSGTFDSGNLGMSVRSNSSGASVKVTDTTFENVYLGIQTGSGGPYSFTAENVTVNNSVSGFGHQSETGSAVVRDSDITVNTQGVGIYKANNAVIENNSITVDADAIDGEEPVFDTERGVDFSGSNVTIVENEIESSDTGILSGSYGIPVEDVTITDNEIDAQSVAVNDTPDNLDLDSVRAANEFTRAAYLIDSDGVQSDAIYGSISRAVDAAVEGDSVAVDRGTYDEDVTVDTSNVSILGQGDDTVINGLVYLNAQNATLTDVAVEPDEFVRPSDGDIPKDEKQAILITASNVSVYDSTVDVSLDANGDFEEVNAIQVFGGEPITDVRIVNNDITGTASNDDVAGVVGVSDQAETEGTLVFNNSISVDSEGYSFGVVTRASGGSNIEETPETVVVYNDIDATADAYPGVGYGIESTDEAQVDPNAQIVKDNTFGDVDSIQLKAAEGTLDVTMNEWEDLENVSFRTDGFGTPVQNGGEIVYDPFLTSSPNASDFTRPGERTDFGHDLVVPADGEPHSVAFPAPVEGDVSEVFGDFNGTVYAYDGDEWKSGEEVRDEDIDALDAFAVTVDEGEQDLRIDFEYAESDDPVPSMTTADLEEGWNFVGAPSGNVNSDEAFAGSTADVTTVIDAIAGPNSETTPYGLDASGEVSNPSEVSPFKGYWVFVTDDGELGATVPVEPTQETEEGALTGN